MASVISSLANPTKLLARISGNFVAGEGNQADGISSGNLVAGFSNVAKGAFSGNGVLGVNNRPTASPSATVLSASITPQRAPLG